MKAISIKQPFASLIKSGVKRYEFRSWRTSYRGEILVCSSKRAFWKCDPDQYPLGESVCVVTISDVILTESLAESERVISSPENPEEKIDVLGNGLKYAWVLDSPYPVISRNVKGSLGLFTAPDEFKACG